MKFDFFIAFMFPHNKEPLSPNMTRKIAPPVPTSGLETTQSHRGTVFGQIRNSGFRGFNVRSKEKIAKPINKQIQNQTIYGKQPMICRQAIPANCD